MKLQTFISKKEDVRIQGFDKSEKDLAFEFKRKVKEQRRKLISEKPKKQQLYCIFALILNQKRLVYTTCNALMYYLRCYKCRKQGNLKTSRLGKMDYFLNKGIKKLSHDLDITNILDIIKGSRIMRYLVLNKDDHFLLKNQREYMIDSSDESENEDTNYKDKIVGREDAEMYDLQAQHKNMDRIFSQKQNYMDKS